MTVQSAFTDEPFSLQRRNLNGQTPRLKGWGFRNETDKLTDVLLGSPAYLRHLATSSLSRKHLRDNPCNIQSAQAQHKELVSAYEHFGVKIHWHQPTPELPMQVYSRDSSVMTPYGAIITAMSQFWRRGENYAAIRTFVPMTIGGVPSLLAGYTCTPLVRFTLEGLEDGAKARGTTLAELGNRNQPLDMVVYEKEGDKYLLMSNTARGVMKISLKDIAREEGITEPVRTASGTAGQTYDTIKELEGTVQLDRLSNDQAVVVVQKGNELSLRTVTMP